MTPIAYQENISSQWHCERHIGLKKGIELKYIAKTFAEHLEDTDPLNGDTGLTYHSYCDF